LGHRRRIWVGALAIALPLVASASIAATFDPAVFLPPPPASGSPAQQHELGELRQIVAARSADALSQAVSDDRTEDPSIFRVAIGDGFDLAALPATAKLLNDIDGQARDAENAAKKLFRRDRPWIADPSLATCATRGGDHTSYPSGHATMGYAAGVTLAALLPARAPAILLRARSFAENRMVCGMHYRSDIVAGQVLGTTVASTLLRDPAFRAEIDAAEAELKAAHLAP
jgi:acid phosphatase (class A)